MSLLDDVRRLAETAPGCANGLCHVCGSPGALIWESGPTRHALDCPWLSMPRIAAALEVIEEINGLLDQHPRGVFDHPADQLVERLCALVEGEDLIPL